MYNLETIIEELMEKSLRNDAKKYLDEEEFHVAKKLYLKLLKVQKRLLILDKNYYGNLIVITLNTLASIHKEENSYISAIRYYKYSTFIIEKLLDIDSIEKSSMLAQNYRYMADLYRIEYQYEESIYFYGKARDIYLNISINDYKRELLSIYNSLSIVANEENRFKDTEDAYLSALSIYKELVEEEPDRYNSELALTLYNLASLYFKNNRVNKAGEVYLLALELLLYLHQKEPFLYKDTVASTLYYLGKVYTTQHEYVDALSAYRASLNHYIELSEDTPSKYAPYIAMIFKDLSSYYLTQNKMDMAQYFHLKLVNIYKELIYYDEDRYTLELASSIIDGVRYYQQHTISLYEAEAIIFHKDYLEVDDLLEEIECLRYEHCPSYA